MDRLLGYTRALALAGGLALGAAGATSAAGFPHKSRPAVRPDSAPTPNSRVRTAEQLTLAQHAPRRRAADRRARARAPVARPYAPPPYQECVSQYDKDGVPMPAYTHCEAAFRRLYSR